MKKLSYLALATAWIASLASTAAQATENGGSVYPLGVQTVANGLMMAPGDYLLSYNQWIHANKIVDGSGKNALPDPKLNVEAHALRYLHVFENLKIAGGNLSLEADWSYVDSKLNTPFFKAHASGFGDLTVGPSIGWHSPTFHQQVSLLATLPTGSYDAKSALNIGRNYYAVTADYAFTWFFAPQWELSSMFMVIANGKNRDDGYKSGIETNVEFSLDHFFPNRWFAGVGGYWHNQLTDDTLNGQAFNGNGNRVRDFAIGPQVGYATDKVGVYLAWQHQVYVRNAAKGDRLWLNAFIKF
ncbi:MULTISPECIES: SphA family protein [Burkholderia]|jgi:hypothetical protein|uniref:Transporter n=2 Tax=Burkholderia contaminans TaxID=488447 RepID=A0A1E3FRY7_9BURK|nr:MULTISPECIES: transporter [Burkholderia]UTP27159.1 transporter [Burkholderia sp. FXe9]KKL41829.1 hypothetical protein WR31_07325 [Burkholderia contaminans LMG 23361]MBH9693097.1 transporter [Burkholderia contaminans]MBK1906210.1 transporter [Burkholderia contaminans]MBK1914239.1 transporter [Burkholderia contaminans]